MDDAGAANYVRDLGRLLAEQGREAKERRDAAGEDDKAFERGRLTAYYEVVSLMQQQAGAFGYEDADVGLDGVDPDRDLR